EIRNHNAIIRFPPQPGGTPRCVARIRVHLLPRPRAALVREAVFAEAGKTTGAPVGCADRGAASDGLARTDGRGIVEYSRLDDLFPDEWAAAIHPALAARETRDQGVGSRRSSKTNLSPLVPSN